MIDGVVRTRVGYAGGTTPNPDYGHIGDHTETVQVDYDPTRVSYDDLLEIFWESHSPFGRSWSRQYLNAVFYHDERQRRRALASKSALSEKLDREIYTDILPLRSFTWAEDYHQKYLLKREQGMAQEYRRIYPLEKDFINSTAVARVNGYLGGGADPAQLAREIDQLGLSTRGRARLESLVRP